MKFVNEEWAITWRQEYRALLEGIAKRGVGGALVLFWFFLLALWALRVSPLDTMQVITGLVWGSFIVSVVDESGRRPSFSPLFAARLRAVACQALLLVGLCLALQLAFFAVALSAGVRLTVPLQALASHNPELTLPSTATQSARVLTPAALGSAFGLVAFTCVGLSVRLAVGHKPKPRWATALAHAAYLVPCVGFAFVAEATCVATYRSPLAAVAVGLLVIATYALLVALLGRQWEAHASAEAAEPSVAEA